ncbi:VOC family protein [Paenibacillus alkalitolerans]|uniref:VOC family protein n=1 Tax=Paenibacillus alkalitolerans TaxID=2799335 RepID=UPI0018F78C4F|nr:VOC family protein [Paenibacillus alkalitolerans]
MLRVHHMALETPDLGQSISFYTELFGFELQRSVRLGEENIAFLTQGGFTLELIEANNCEPPGTSVHFAVEVDDFEAWPEKLAAAGVPVAEGPLRFENGWKTIFIQGPSGELLELLNTGDNVVL